MFNHAPLSLFCVSPLSGLNVMMSFCVYRGSSPPEVVLPLPDWPPAMHPGSLEEVGPLVETVYELRNHGPSAVNARLTVDYFSTWRHHFLLYVFSNASEDSLTCRPLNTSQIDPFKLVGNRSSVSVVSQSVQQEETKSHSPTVHLTPYLNYELTSSASYDVINTSSKVQPLLLPSGHTQTRLSVLWRPPDGENNVPIGYIVLSIICGLLLLGVLCFIFWKLGFFKRTRPPTDDDDDDEEQRLAEESHD
ncbi:integrin alpha-8-like isoform X2 [Epinephelus moara]|uniref:integrin alpha-8-like isoform X2 n=1 Tax=Epinephelus moara TaxID=300413 RepID=UPI00214E5388|nr:integrin alpha-8-like isoform X2 [Epinephelus moara]